MDKSQSIGAVRGSQTKLEACFDNQLKTLERRGVGITVLSKLQEQRSAVIDEAIRIIGGLPDETDDGNFPFIPIIPLTYFGYYGLVTLAMHDAEEYIQFDVSEISDVVKTPEEPYYVLNVEDGTMTRGLTVEKGTKFVIDRERFPLTTVEALSLSLVTDVLTRHDIAATCSRRKKDFTKTAMVPLISQDHLDWILGFIGKPDCGTPSCQRRRRPTS